MSASSTPDDWADKVEDLREQAAARTGAAADHAVHAADVLKGAATDAASDLNDAANQHLSRAEAMASAGVDELRANTHAATANLRDAASSIAADLKSQAAGHVEDAKGVISSMADEARSRITGIIDQQKSLGADKLSGISKVAHNAAADLDAQNPHMAKLVRDAAGSVDMIAGNLRASSLGDVVASVSNFARKQPVAFFAGSVLAGFALARFIKSEPPHPRTESGEAQS